MRPPNWCRGTEVAIGVDELAVHPHGVDSLRRDQRFGEAVALPHRLPVEEHEGCVGARPQYRVLQPQEPARQRAHPVHDLLYRDSHLAGHAQCLRERSDGARMWLLAGARHETVGADGHAGPAEEPLHGGVVAVVGDDGDLAPVGHEEVDDRLVCGEGREVLVTGRSGHVAQTLAEELIADAGAHAGDLHAVQPAAEVHEVVPGGCIPPDALVGVPPGRRVAEAGEVLAPEAGANLRREDGVTGGAAGRVGVHVLHRGDEVGGLVDEGDQLVVLVPVAAAGDLAVLVAVAAAALEGGDQHLVERGHDLVALGAQVREQRPRLDVVEGRHQQRQFPAVAVNRWVVDQPGRESQRQRCLAPDHLAHVSQFLIVGHPRLVAHDDAAHGAVPEVDAHVGDRASPMPVQELLPPWTTTIAPRWIRRAERVGRRTRRAGRPARVRATGRRTRKSAW